MNSSRIPTGALGILLVLLLHGLASGQRMQFPTQLPLDAAPTLSPGLAPGPAATFQGTIQAPPSIQPPPTWDPYSTPSVEPSTLFPQDPTLPSMPTLGGGTPIGTQRAFQGAHLNYEWLVGSGQKELGINDIEINGTFAFPFFYSTESPLLVTPGFALHLFNGPWQPFPDLPPSVYDAYLDAAWNPKITSWFSGELAFRIGVYTDFRGVNMDSIRYTGQGFAVLSFTPSFQVKAGVMYLDRVVIKLLPSGGIIWTPSPDMRFEILFPNPRISRRCTTVGNTDWWCYLRGDYGGGSWTVMHTTIPGTPTERIDYNDMRVALGMEFRGLRGFIGNLEVGCAFEREVVYHDYPDSTFRPNTTVFVGGGMVY